MTDPPGVVRSAAHETCMQVRSVLALDGMDGMGLPTGVCRPHASTPRRLITPPPCDVPHGWQHALASSCRPGTCPSAPGAMYMARQAGVGWFAFPECSQAYGLLQYVHKTIKRYTQVRRRTSVGVL